MKSDIEEYIEALETENKKLEQKILWLKRNCKKCMLQDAPEKKERCTCFPKSPMWSTLPLECTCGKPIKESE